MSEDPKYIRFTDNEQINQLLHKVVFNVQTFTQHQLKQIDTLTEIGTALSAEKNIDRLLELIVNEARQLTNADAGTLYIMDSDNSVLQFAIVQNETINTFMGGTRGEITWPPVNLVNPDGSPNHQQVSAYVALTGDTVNIPDVYDYEGFVFEGTRKFDHKTGYRSKSVLVFPLKNHENEIIGVLQLFNAKDSITKETITFSKESQLMAESMASQAAVALTNNKLIKNLEDLFESFIRLVATAIDEKSKYTGGHIRRMSELTMLIAEHINNATEGPYANISLNPDEMKELYIAAWLHDIGKIVTPEYVVDKATKLETIFDRIEIVKARYEVLKRDAQLKINQYYDSKTQIKPFSEDDYNRELQELDDELKFLINNNIGGEYLPPEKVEHIKEISNRKIVMNGEEQNLLSESEVYNLSISKGTLNNEEREIINNHVVVTYKMLMQLPFPKKLKNVPIHAATHHEKLDGTGYPFKLKSDQLPLQSRIMAIADIFEALTARDRPYKKAKQLSECVKIMGFMVKDQHIDGQLFQFFLDKKIHIDYALRELNPNQIDLD